MARSAQNWDVWLSDKLIIWGCQTIIANVEVGDKEGAGGVTGIVYVRSISLPTD